MGRQYRIVKNREPPIWTRERLRLIFIAAFFALGCIVWSTLLQFQSYGVIEGRVIAVSAPWDGSIYNWQVRDGKEVEVSLEPYAQKNRCTVDRFGDQFESAPHSIERYYHINQALLPVYLTPNYDTQNLLAARLGGTVKRPYKYSEGLSNIFSDSRETVKSWLPQLNQPTQPDGAVGSVASQKDKTIGGPNNADDSVKLKSINGSSANPNKDCCS